MNITSMITGASGLLGRSLVNRLMLENNHVVACFKTHSINFGSPNCTPVKVDLEDLAGLNILMKKVRPSLIIHCAGFTNVDLCENQPELAFRLNVKATKALAALSYELNAKFVYISTDHLYDGKKSFYSEEEVPNPINAYGMTKWQGEMEALKENPESLVIRTNFFGKGTQWRQSLTDWIWCRLNGMDHIPAFMDSYFTPIAIPDLVATIIQLIEHNASGRYNVCGSERLSKYEFALKFAEYFYLKTSNIQPVKIQDMNLSAKRPQDMSLEVKKVSTFLNIPMPNIEQSFRSIEYEYKK